MSRTDEINSYNPRLVIDGKQLERLATRHARATAPQVGRSRNVWDVRRQSKETARRVVIHFNNTISSFIPPYPC